MNGHSFAILGFLAAGVLAAPEVGYAESCGLDTLAGCVCDHPLVRCDRSGFGGSPCASEPPTPERFPACPYWWPGYPHQPRPVITQSMLNQIHRGADCHIVLVMSDPRWAAADKSCRTADEDERPGCSIRTAAPRDISPRLSAGLVVLLGLVIRVRSLRRAHSSLRR